MISDKLKCIKKATAQPAEAQPLSMATGKEFPGGHPFGALSLYAEPCSIPPLYPRTHEQGWHRNVIMDLDAGDLT